MSVPVSDQFRLKETYRTAGFEGNMFRKSNKKTYLSTQALTFLKQQAVFNRVNRFLPAGSVFDAVNQRVISRKSILEKRKDRLKKRIKERGIKFDKKQRTLTFTGNTFITGTARITANVPTRRGPRIETKTINFPNMPYDNNRDAERELKLQILALLDSPPLENNIISVEILNSVIVRNGDQTIGLPDIRLRRAFLSLDSYDTDNVDQNNDTCFKDAFMYRFKDDKNIHSDAIDDEVWNDFFSQHNPNWEQDGITCNEFREYCKMFDIPMCLIQDDRTPIVSYYPKDTDEFKVQNKLPKTFVAVVRDEHVYLVKDNSILRSVMNRLKDHGGVKFSKETKSKVEKQLPVEYLDIRRSREQVVADKLRNVTEEQCRHTSMVNIMEDKNTNVLSTNIIYEDKKLQEFELLGTKYVFLDDDKELMIKYSECQELKYNGKSVNHLVTLVLKTHDIPMSYCNNRVNELLMVQGVKDRTHRFGSLGCELTEDNRYDIEEILESRQNQLKRRYKNENITTYDIKRCHTDILENYPDNWICFTPQDEPMETTQETEIKPGLYYIETDDRKLFIGNNWYSYRIVDYGITKKLIDKSNIKYHIHSSNVQSRYTYTNVIKEIKSLTYNKNVPFEIGDMLCKRMCNTISGITGKTTNKNTKHFLTWSKHEMLRHIAYHATQPNVKVFCYPSESKNGTFYHYGHTIIRNRNKHNLPHYIQILDEQLIKSYDSCVAITNNNWDNVLQRHCDAITILNAPSVNSKKYKEIVTNKQGGLRVQENPLKPINSAYHDVDINSDLFKLNWNLQKTTSNQYQQFFDLIDNKKSALITAPGGYGKSYIIGKIQEKYENVMNVAFMNTHAYRIKGKTFHKTFGIDQDENKIHRNRLIYLKKNPPDVILVDECGTLNSHLWLILQEVKTNCNVPILCFGSFKQLKPIDKGDYSDHTLSFYVCDGTRYELEYHDKCRCDPELNTFLQTIKPENNSYDSIDEKLREVIPTSNNLPLTNIVFTNEYRYKVNKLINYKCSKSTTSVFHKNLLCPLIQYEDTSHSCYLYKGCRFMSIVNENEKNLYFNGERWFCIDFDNETILLKSELRDTIIRVPYSTMVDFDLAYAITCHKIQGDTLYGPVMIHQRDVGFKFDCNWITTAVERPKKLNQILLPTDNLIKNL